MRELLCHSLDGRRVDLLTLTSYKNLTFNKEELIPNVFPSQTSSETRPFKARKPTIFISARVHPGEVPSSFVMNGILDFLTNENNE